MTGYDTVRSQLFRLSLEDLVDLERKRKCGMSRREILANVYCPVTPSSPVITPAQDHAALSSLLAQSNAICIEGSRSAYATNSLPWSNNNYTSNNDHANQRINIAKKEAALKSVIKKEVRAAQKLKDKQMEMDGLDDDDPDADIQPKRKFVVLNNGWPINPDYQILKDAGKRPSTSQPRNTFGTRYSLANINPVSPFNGGSGGGCNTPFHKECAVATNWGTSPLPPSNPQPTRPKTVNITVKEARTAVTPASRRKFNRSPSRKSNRSPSRENKKENNRRDYQQGAITPSKLDKRRARSTTPDHSASSVSRSKTPEHKVGRITPSTPQPSNNLVRRTLFREKTNFFKRRSNAIESIDDTRTANSNNETKESNGRKKNNLKASKSDDFTRFQQQNNNSEESEIPLKGIKNNTSAINVSKWSKLSGEIKVENNSSTESAMNNTKTSKTPRKGRSTSKKSNENKNTATPSIRIQRSQSRASLRSSKSRDMNVDDVSDSENEDNVEEEIQLAVSPRFNWKDVDGVAKPNATISDIAEDEQLIRRNLMSLHRAVNQKDRILLAQLTQAGIDMTLPLKGVTALSLALKSKEMFILVLDALKQTQQIRRAVNVRSVDKASRREPPLVTASRMGQTECVKLLLGCLPELDIERKDGQGRTALWHAVQEQRDDIVALLVEAGARLYYEGDHDMPCPLTLACRCTLTTIKGREIAKYLIRHGANVNYQDHALRNALYWTVYGCAPELALFLLEAGAIIKPYSWLQDDALPTAFIKDNSVHTKIQTARDSPPSLVVLSRAVFRYNLIEKACGTSIYPFVKKMSVSEDMKNLICLQTVGRSRHSSGMSVSKKLDKLNNETKV